jgi:topoisomerase-4 subunit A
VKVRAKINKVDNKTLSITEIPFSKTTSTLTESILKANEKGKIKIRKVDDMTAKNAEIVIHLAPGVSSDKTIDALYAFTDCEISISPNCCVIDGNNKPRFLRVSDVLRHIADRTVQLLKMELEIQKGELLESLHFASLEKIFIEEQIYKDKEYEQAKDLEKALAHILKRLEAIFVMQEIKPIRAITHDDLLRLVEIKMRRIFRFNKDEADRLIASYHAQITQIDHDIKHIIAYAVDWFTKLKAKFGTDHPRMTEIRSFDTIEATKVVEANEKLYINREEGFIGYGLKKDEYICPCSDIDDVIIFYKDGKFKIVKVAEKMFVGKNVLYLNVFKRNDNRTVYNAIYRDGKLGAYYIKRFPVTAVNRDREYDLTTGKPGSKVFYFSANPNGEAESVRVVLKPKPRQKLLMFDKEFSDIPVKGRGIKGLTLTKAEIHKITLKTKGGSTLGGRQVWFDRDVLRVNYDSRGEYLGEFAAEDLIVVITENGEFFTTTFDATNHYPEGIRVIEKFNPNKIWTAALFNKDQKGLPYLKRFMLEASNRPQTLLGENAASQLLILTDTYYPRIEVVFGGNDSFRETLIIDVEEFIGVKGFRALGKRITTFETASIREIEPVRFPEIVKEEAPQANIEIEEEEEKPLSELLDEITGQQRLF